jgi:hypothetical protein
VSTALWRSDDHVVVYADFRSDSPPPEPDRQDPWRAVAVGEEPCRPPGRIPARWSPRPVRVLRGRFARSQLADDLRAHSLTFGLLLGALIGAFVFDDLQALVLTLTGGLK